ncbi:hypothetical protein BC629DRAFT_980917 [Irpex lacteus]|nr:hypothetical protein BC629DRAFT_980917 [Irpex lacteus]
MLLYRPSNASISMLTAFMMCSQLLADQGRTMTASLRKLPVYKITSTFAIYPKATSNFQLASKIHPELAKTKSRSTRMPPSTATTMERQ